MSYRPTIGLEVHAELSTRTKMFCSCKNDPNEMRANVNICPVCLAHPGTLPVVNREAVQKVLMVGSALGAKLADFSEFDRKSYFYPDIPKGYQISQYEHPLVAGGSLAGVAITRVHLEEDTARSSHDASKSPKGGAGGKSLVDFNRAGIPLMELVTEPVIHDAETAGRFARELQLLLRTLGASEANLEKGEMRIEANISVSKDAEKFGTKVEVKNLNSFRSVERAIEHEVARQIALIESGGVVVQATRGWDEGKQETFHQRTKEGSADYRYFPEPDLPKLLRSDAAELSDEALRAKHPELPEERRARYSALGIKDADIEFIIASAPRRTFFDAVLEKISDAPTLVALATNYLVSDLAGDPGAIEPAQYAALLEMVAASELSSRGAKDTLALMRTEGGSPKEIAKTKGLLQVHDESVLASAIQAVLAAEEKAVGEYRAGKAAALQYLVGKTMAATRGAGNPNLLRELIEKALS